MMIGMNSVSYVQDDITGMWYNQEKDAKIKIYAASGKYFGSIQWLKTPIDPETGKPKLDKHNPDDALKTRPVMGLLILKYLTWDADDQNWSGGIVYDPKSGNNYSLTCTLQDKNTMELRGYLGFSLFGRTDIWTRDTETQ
ncbi:MAG: DUF2147 domain-containing protein [Bacteroidetes bacterium]|nr:DUF2147 domain-containing protein [Bacteroidota bacterium]